MGTFFRPFCQCLVYLYCRLALELLCPSFLLCSVYLCEVCVSVGVVQLFH